MEMAENSKMKIERKKIIAISIAIILIIASLFAVWYLFLKPWDIRQLATHVIGTDTYSPSFAEDLAGRTVQVAGKITNLTVYDTTNGPLSEIWLDDFHFLSLMLWIDLADQLGKNIIVNVSFEWSICNHVEKVLSPQVFMLPGNGVLLLYGMAAERVNSANGAISIESLEEGGIRVKLDDVKYPSDFKHSNCTLKEGVHEGALEYVDFLGTYIDNPTYDRIENLSISQIGENGKLTYIDVNDNEMIDGGDYLDIIGLTYPNTESGARTYMLVIEREIDFCPILHTNILGYITLFKNGPIRVINGNPPYSRMIHEFMLDGSIKLTVDYVSREAHLENFTEIKFKTTSNLIRTWEYDHNQTSRGGDSYMNLSGKIGSLPEELDLFLSFHDVQDNGLFDKDDQLIIKPTNGTYFVNFTELYSSRDWPAEYWFTVYKIQMYFSMNSVAVVDECFMPP